MTITINLTEQDVAQASKSLIGLIQSCAEIELTDTSHKTKTTDAVVVPDKVYEDEPTPAKPKVKASKPAPQTRPVEAPDEKPETETEEIELIEEPAKETDAVTPEEVEGPNYTKLRDALKAECAAIARDGKTKALKALLTDYGVEKLSELPDDKIEEFRTAAKAL